MSHRSLWLVQVGAFLPRDPHVAQRLRDQQHAVPLLMVHGSSDMLVPLERRHAAQQESGGASSCCRAAAARFCMKYPACAPACPASLPAATPMLLGFAASSTCVSL